MKNGQELLRQIKQTRKQLGLNGESQQKLLKKVRATFDLTNEELAAALGASLDALLAYLAPQTAKKFRKMPDADRLVLSRILDTKRKRK